MAAMVLVAIFGLPFVERRRADAVLAADLRRLQATLLLSQNRDDLFLGEP